MSKINNVIGLEVRRRLMDIEDIKRDSDESVKRSIEALEKAIESMQMSDITKKQLIEALKAGDQVYEVQTLRVDPVTGEVYDTAADRFEANQRKTIEEIESTVRKGDLFLNVKDYGALGDGENDDWEAISKALTDISDNGGGILYFPVGIYRVTRTVWVHSRDTMLAGTGEGTEIIYDGDDYDSSSGDNNGIAVVYMGRPLDATDGKYDNIQIRDIKINGGLKTLWGIYSNRSYNSHRVERVQIWRSAGFIKSVHCYASIYRDVRVSYNTVYPTMSNLDWSQVHDTGLFSFEASNGTAIENLRIRSVGESNENRLTKSLFYLLQNYSLSIENLTFEYAVKKERDMASDEDGYIPTFESVFYAPGNVNLNIDKVYMEHMDTKYILVSDSPRNHNITIDNIFINHSYVANNLVRADYGKNITVGKFYVGNTLFTEQRYLIYTNGNPVSMTSPILWESPRGERVLINGNLYADSKKPGKLGLASSDTQILSDGSTIPRVVDGFDVSAGKDQIGIYVAVSPGTIINPQGERVRLGVFAQTQDIGWVLRTSVGVLNTKYFVCIDANGGVFLEHHQTPRIRDISGKIIIAILTIEDGAVKSLNKMANTSPGVMIRGGNNRKVYRSNVPSSGYWTKGDIVSNTDPETDTLMWRRMTDGTDNSPNDWREIKV